MNCIISISLMLQVWGTLVLKRKKKKKSKLFWSINAWVSGLWSLITFFFLATAVEIANNTNISYVLIVSVWQHDKDFAFQLHHLRDLSFWVIFFTLWSIFTILHFPKGILDNSVTYLCLFFRLKCLQMSFECWNTK